MVGVCRVIRCIGCPEKLESLIEPLRGHVLFIVFGGSTATSTIPGISIAGPSPEATLYTPTLDLEYLVAGKPRTLDVIPVSPEGLPTPALISRSLVARLQDVSVAAVDSGLVHHLRVPHVRLPSAVPGGRIDVEDALPRGVAERIYGDAGLLGRVLAGGFDAVMVGETIPGGTTTAAAIMEALGVRALGRVSSSSPDNPHELRGRVVRAALERLGRPGSVFETVDIVGDPVHIAIAGFAIAAAGEGVRVYLAGGTQMAAVLTLIAKLEPKALERVAVATTRWIVEDKTSDIEGLVRDATGGRGVPILYTDFSMAGSKFEGLRAYEKGYVKEGVGAGGALVLAAARGMSGSEILGAVEAEYERLLGGKG
jgi:uncharacterized protein (TIGR00303 family)